MKQLVATINCIGNVPVYLVTINKIGYVVAFSDKFEELCPCCMSVFERNNIMEAVRAANFKERTFWVFYKDYAYQEMCTHERFIRWIEHNWEEYSNGKFDCKGLFKMGVLEDLLELKKELGVL